jgi:hypothetical protein
MKICEFEFAICRLEHLRNLGICDSEIVFYVCVLEFNFALIAGSGLFIAA